MDRTCARLLAPPSRSPPARGRSRVRAASLPGCGGDGARGADAAVAGADAGAPDAAQSGGRATATAMAAATAAGDMTPPCTTRIDYGSAWIHAAGHPASFDVTAGVVSWDRVCHDDGANS